MIKLHISFWELMMYGAALYIIGVFMIRGQLLKHRLRRQIIAKKRAVSKAALPAAA